jgi:glycosyltransferase involved in cell wall biosynthesis
MVPKKGFDGLIRALPLLDEASIELVLVGNGDCRAEWEALAQSLGVARRVRFTGNVPYDQIADYYNLADIFVMPSAKRPADGLNVCVLDAMACGKPIVGSTVAGNPLVITDGDNGLLVPERDPDALANAISRLAGDPALRAGMGARSRQRIELEFAWPHLARRYVGHFGRMGVGSRE